MAGARGLTCRCRIAPPEREREAPAACASHSSTTLHTAGAARTHADGRFRRPPSPPPLPPRAAGRSPKDKVIHTRMAGQVLVLVGTVTYEKTSIAPRRHAGGRPHQAMRLSARKRACVASRRPSSLLLPARLPRSIGSRRCARTARRSQDVPGRAALTARHVVCFGRRPPDRSAPYSMCACIAVYSSLFRPPGYPCCATIYIYIYI